MKIHRFITIVIPGILVIALSHCSFMSMVVMNSVKTSKLTVQDSKLYISGDFNSKSYDQVVSSLDQHPEIKTIILTQSSGSIDDETTFKLGREIRRRKLNTHLLSSSEIASGAVDLFLSGSQRTIERGARMGVHSWTDGFTEAKDIPRSSSEHKLNAEYIQKMLGDDSFYWFTIYAAPADSVKWLTERDIRKFKLATRPMMSAY